MNAFNNGECVWFLCGGQWMEAKVTSKIDAEKHIGNLKIISSHLDPLYELKLEKENKCVIQAASALQRNKSGESGSQQLGSGAEHSVGQQQSMFNKGEKCGFSLGGGQCCCGTVKHQVPEKEELHGYLFYNSKKDPYYVVENNDGTIFYVPTSILKKDEQFQHTQTCTSQKGVSNKSDISSGIQSGGFGSQTGEHLTGSQGLAGSQQQTGLGSQHQTGLGSQQPLSQHDVKNVPIE